MGSETRLGVHLAAPLALLSLLSASAAAADISGKQSVRPKKKAVTTLTLSDLGAPSLLSADEGRDPAAPMSTALPSTDGLIDPPRYVLGREGSATTGKRATLSVDVGGTRLFAVGGKLRPRERAGLDEQVAPGQSRSTAPRKLESGRLYGAGVERRLGPVQVGAEYQYSTVSDAELDPSATGPSLYDIDMDGRRKSHGVRATAKLRF